MRQFINALTPRGWAVAAMATITIGIVAGLISDVCIFFGWWG